MSFDSEVAAAAAADSGNDKSDPNGDAAPPPALPAHLFEILPTLHTLLTRVTTGAGASVGGNAATASTTTATTTTAGVTSLPPLAMDEDDPSDVVGGGVVGSGMMAGAGGAAAAAADAVRELQEELLAAKRALERARGQLRTLPDMARSVDEQAAERAELSRKLIRAARVGQALTAAAAAEVESSKSGEERKGTPGAEASAESGIDTAMATE